MQYFSSSKKKDVEVCRENARTLQEYRRSLIIILWMKGYGVSESADILGMSRAAIYKWLHRYKTHGIEALKPIERKGRPAKVSVEYLYKLQTTSSTSPSVMGYSANRWTLKLLRNHLAKETGLSISLEHLRRLRKKLKRPKR